MHFNFWSSQTLPMFPYTPDQLPPPRSGGALVPLGMYGDWEYFLLAGGLLSDHETLAPDCWLFSANTYEGSYTWTPFTTVSPAVFDPFVEASLVYPGPAVGSFDWNEYRTVYAFFGATSTSGVTNAVRAIQVGIFSNTITQIHLVDVSGDPPAARTSASCGYSPLANTTVCFGGLDSDQVFNDTWIFDHTTLSWSEITPLNGESPFATYGALSAYSPTLDALILLGGLTSNDSNTAVVFQKTFWIFSFETLEWKRGSPVSSDVEVGFGALLLSQYEYSPHYDTMFIVAGISSSGVTSRVLYAKEYSVVINDTQSEMSFYTIQDDTLTPDARQLHCSASSAGYFIMGFGINTVPLNSVFMYVNSKWIRIQPASELSPSPRFSACSVSVGTSVYFFGGFTSADKKQMSDELWMLTLNASAINYGEKKLKDSNWTKLASASMPRAAHSCYYSSPYFVVVGGVVGDPNSYSNSIAVFDLRIQEWISVETVNGADPRKAVPLTPRAGHSLYVDANGTAFIHGGAMLNDNRVTILSDMIKILPIAVLPAGATLLVETTSVSYTPAFRRAYAAAAGSASNLLICGGMTTAAGDLLLTSSKSSECNIISLARGLAVPFKLVPDDTNYRVWYIFGGVGATLFTDGSSITIYGGTAALGSTARPSMLGSVLLEMTFKDNLCQGNSSMLACWACAPGSVMSDEYQDCIRVPPGYYSSDGFNQFPCPAGRYYGFYGAVSVEYCLLCPTGTFAPNSGSRSCMKCPSGAFCPMGSVTPNQTTTEAVSVSQQPALFEPGVIPPKVMVAAALAVSLGLLITLFLVYAAHVARKRRRQKFFNEGSDELLLPLYTSLRRPHFGLDLKAFLEAVAALGVPNLPSELAARLIAENDNDGCGFLTFTTFKEALIYLIQNRLMKPFPGTKAANDLSLRANSHFVLNWLAEFDLKSFDAYDQDHALAIEGEARRVQTTVSGGVTRLVFYCVAVAATIALTGQFIFSNVTETRSTLPAVQFDNAFLVKSFTVAVAARGVPSSMSEDCISQEKTFCSTKVNKSTSGSSTFTNTYADGACTVTFQCNDCIMNLDSVVSVNFSFGGDIFASQLHVRVSSSTGVVDDVSVVDDIFSPQNNDFVFRGHPSTIAHFDALPTTFSTVNNIFQQQQFTRTGFHVTTTTTSLGNAVDEASLSRYRTVPVEIVFSVGNSVLSVSRLPTSTFVDFLSQMLGSIGGLGGILVTIMQIFDSKKIGRRHEKRRKELEEASKIEDIDSGERAIGLITPNGKVNTEGDVEMDHANTK